MMPTFPRSPLSFRTAGFPQYGWKAGFPSGAFLDDQRLKPAPGMRRPTSSLHPPFARLVVSTVVPLCVGPPTRLGTAVEGHYSSAPGALAQGRDIVSPTVLTYFAPSAPGEFHRRFSPEHRRRHWPSPWTKGLGTPDVPAIRFARGTFSGLLWFATVTACQVAGPPVRT